MLHVGCCWLKFDHFQTVANNTQHVITPWPNASNMLRPTMLRCVALACCDRLAGALEQALEHQEYNRKKHMTPPNSLSRGSFREEPAYMRVVKGFLLYEILDQPVSSAITLMIQRINGCVYFLYKITVSISVNKKN